MASVVRKPLISVVDGYRPGFLLLEAVLSLGLFIIFLGAFGITVYEGQGQTKAGGDRKRGVKLASEAIEGGRSIAAKTFSTLTTGPHGVVLDNVTGQWKLSGTSATSTGGYTTVLTVTSLATDQLLLKGVTTWYRSPTRPQTVTLYSVVTDWRKSKTIGNWGGGALSPAGTYTYDYSAVDPSFTDVAISGTTAYLASTNGSVPGVTIVDVTTAASPTRIGTLAVTGGAYALAIRGSTLFVVTSDANAEIKSYDISTPASPVLLASYDLPGSGAANSIAVAGDFLYVGATGLGRATSLPELQHKNLARKDSIFMQFFIPHAEATQCVDYIVYDGSGSAMQICCRADQHVQGTICAANSSSSSSSTSSAGVASSSSSSSSGPYPNGNDFFSFDVSSPSQIRYLHSLYIGGVKSIALFGTAAYLGSTVDTQELQVINITNPTAMTVVGTKSDGFTRDGLATAVGPTTLMFGVQKTAVGNGVMHLYDLQGGAGMPTAGPPWDYTSSGSTVRVVPDPTACYAFTATNWFRQSLQIVKINPASSPTLLQSYSPSPTDSGFATSVFHTPGNDRLYLTTSKRLFIFTPTAGNSVCP